MRDVSTLQTARAALFSRPARAARPRPWRWALVGAAAAAAVAAIVALRSRPAPDLAFELGDPPRAGVVGAWVAAGPASALPLSFEDGSRFELEAGSRGRVVAASRRDAVVLLEAGRVHGEVSAQASASWRIVAGPFEIACDKARLDVAWSVERGELVVTVTRGRVVVRGPGAAEGVAVSGGEALKAFPGESRLELGRIVR